MNVLWVRCVIFVKIVEKGHAQQWGLACSVTSLAASNSFTSLVLKDSVYFVKKLETI